MPTALSHFTSPDFWDFYQRLPKNVNIQQTSTSPSLNLIPNTLPYISRKLVNYGPFEQGFTSAPLALTHLLKNVEFYGFGLVPTQNMIG